MTVQYHRDPLRTVELRTHEEMANLLGAIDYPSLPPDEVFTFITSHAGDNKNAIGVMNIINGAVGIWRSVDSAHDWPNIINTSSLAAEIAHSITGDSQIALEGLFQATRR